MTRGRMSPAVILALLAVLGFCLGALAAEKPIVITKQASPNAPPQSPDPNWELKEQMGIVPNPGASVPDFDPNGKYAPRKGPAPPMDLKSSYLSEGFEGGVVPPTGWSVIVNNDFTWEIDSYNPYEGIYDATCKYDSFYTGTQDEWIISPLMDFEGATSDLKLEFAVMASYYWAISPYDNYDIEVWISTDGGATFSTKIWDETALGVFTSWVWYEQVVDLSGYVGEKDVMLGFRYYGYDGAQAVLDAISVNDDPAPSGRCCYGDPMSPSCDYITEAACAGLGGSWDADLTCDDPCPIPGPGDNCASPATVTLPADLPYADNNYTCGRGDDYSETCLGNYDGGEDIIYELTVTSDVIVDIGFDPLGTTWTGILIDDACPPDGDCIAYSTTTGSSPQSLNSVQLTAGTYYIMIDTWPSPDCIPEFNLTIDESAPAEPGDNCTDPLMIKLPDDLPYLTTDSTCGRVNDYNNTCLGSYDGGEDIIYEVDVSATSTVDIVLDPKGTTYTGIAVSDVCPGGSTCIATHTNSGSGVHGIYGLTLDPGTYYIMIDTYPSPDCIPEFDLSISTAGGGPENDDCADAIPVGDVTDLAFNTSSATNDGGGTCQTAPNVWYCYTAPCDGIATISLCGSGYDTKMAVYDGCSCDPLPAQLACNDDFCSLQSQVAIGVTEGSSYLIEVGGYGSNTGSGVLNISTECGSPPPNDNCEDVTPVALTTGVTETFTGNNQFSTGDCSTLDPGTAEAWEAFTLSVKSDVTIDYCGTSPSFELVYIVLADQCPCGDLIFATSTNWDLCGGDGNITMTYPGLDAGTYYIPVLSWHPSYPSNYYAGPYTIHVLATEWEPDYCDASGGCDEYISRVQVAEIDNTSACDGYGDFTDQIANMQLGVGYPITITIGNAYSSDYGAVWVDWNQDYDFSDPGESITLTTYSGYGPYTGTITPPGDALPGFTRMRVRLNYYSLPPACGATSYGEAEDYTINVGGEQSILTIDPESIDFGTVLLDETGSQEMTLGADGEAPISFSIGIEYAEKAGYGGGDCDPTLKANPFENEPAIPAMEKDATQLLFEGFESGTVPPPDWTAVVNNPYTWEIDSYNPYEGTYNASCFYDETYSGTQDEWLVSPVIDFGGSKYVLDFWWMGSYYWSVDPYDNCDLEVWISIDGGATWLMELWDENVAGVFTSWEWYNAVVDLSYFKDESNVKLGFHYAGYDGAQFSIDAIGINPAPLSWLSVDPTSGSIPAGGTVPVTVSYDASDLEEQTYEANLVITHTGAPTKTVSVVPVTMNVSTEPPPDITPDPMKFYYAYLIDPMVGHIYIRDDALADYTDYTAANIDPATLEINGDAGICIGDPTWVESFFDVSYSVEGFIEQYPPMWGWVVLPYTVSGQFTDAAPFTLNFEVTGMGFLAGDANLDEKVNVGDAVMIVNYVFRSGEAPQFAATADANCDGSVNIADAVRLVTFIFKNGDAPCHR